MICHIILCLILTAALKPCFSTRCFECQNTPLPHACQKVAECNADEQCYTEQIVTSSGNIVYNTGCISQQRCSVGHTALVGRRSNNSSRQRSLNLNTCVECCTDNFCNNKGCGSQEVPKDQRGPYCFHCESLLDPAACSRVAVCLQNEDCETLSHTVGSNRCIPNCCTEDFCNDKCALPLENSTSTASTYYTSKVTTVTPRTSTALPLTKRCHNDDKYIYLQNTDAELCVHIVNSDHKHWDRAQTSCQNTGDNLVVLDSHSKALLLRDFLAHHSHDYHKEGYWIGAERIFDRFEWLNHTPLNATEADWDSDQPDNTETHNRVCVSMHKHSRLQSYTWHDHECTEKSYNYICEKV